LTISGNTISNNTASSGGGGIYKDGVGAVTISKNSLTMNSGMVMPLAQATWM
jgi:parallel beta-helix repeat protein